MWQRRLAPVAAGLLLCLALLGAPARACPGAGDRAPGCAHGAAPWEREVTLHGRRRSLLSMHGRRCGTPAPPLHVARRVELSLSAHAAREAAFVAAGPRRERQAKVYTIPTYVYNVVSGSNKGFVPDAVMQEQLDALNAAYATALMPDLSVLNSADQAGITWKFEVQSISRVKAGDMCDSGNEKAVKAAHRKGGKGALNLYFTDLSSCGLLGYSSWPWELDPKSGKPDALTMDGVVIHHETMPGGSYKPYNMGRTCIHETGHWMGLYHTFQNGCSKGGDQVDDTPFQGAPTEGCPKDKDTCPQPGMDMISNFLDYTDDKCMKGLTPLQHKRMEAMFQLHRAPS